MNQAEIVGVLQIAEQAVAKQSSVASSALASLDAKLRELPHMHPAAAFSTPPPAN